MMSHIESDPFFVTRMPQWGPVQLTAMVLVGGAYLLGLLFNQTSVVPAYKQTLRMVRLLAEGEAKGHKIKGRSPAEFINKYRTLTPNPGPDALTAVFAWSPKETIHRGRVWQVFTYVLLHDPSPKAFLHCLNTLVVLGLLGGIVERKYGPGRMAVLLLGAAAFGALGTAVLWPGGRFIGANAISLALCVVFIFNLTYEDVIIGRLLPQASTVGTFFCLISIIVSLLYGRSNDPDPQTGVQHMAHIGMLLGALWGFAFFRFEPRVFDRWLTWQIREKQKLKATEADIRLRVDAMLEKIHTEGEGALTRRERSFLRTASKFLRRKQHKDE